MSDTETCSCGHVLDEHEWAGNHAAECLIDGCPCIYFELADESDDDSASAGSTERKA